MFPGGEVLRGVDWEAGVDVEGGVDEVVPFADLDDGRVGREAGYDGVDVSHSGSGTCRRQELMLLETFNHERWFWVELLLDEGGAGDRSAGGTTRECADVQAQQSEVRRKNILWAVTYTRCCPRAVPPWVSPGYSARQATYTPNVLARRPLPWLARLHGNETGRGILG